MSELQFLSLTDPEWAAFVAGRPDSTAFHAPAWAGFLAKTYGFAAAAAVVRDGEQVVAGIPVAKMGRNRWVSLPFTDECPPLGDATRLAAALDAGRGRRTVEVRATLPGATGVSDAWAHVLDLEPGEHDVYAGFHKSQVQRNIRRAEREGVEISVATMESELTRTFYGLHVRTRRRLGAPVQRRRFFSLLWRDVLAPGGGYVLLAHHDGQPVAAAVFLTAGASVIYKFGASDERHWDVRPNHLLFWEAIRRSCAEGRRTFDFGRTDFTDRGLREFKLGWGAVEHEVIHSKLGVSVPSRSRVRGLATGGLVRGVIRTGPPVVCRAAGLFYGRAA